MLDSRSAFLIPVDRFVAPSPVHESSWVISHETRKIPPLLILHFIKLGYLIDSKNHGLITAGSQMAQQAIMATEHWLHKGQNTCETAATFLHIVSCQCGSHEKVPRQGAAEDAPAKP